MAHVGNDVHVHAGDVATLSSIKGEADRNSLPYACISVGRPGDSIRIFFDSPELARDFGIQIISAIEEWKLKGAA